VWAAVDEPAKDEVSIDYSRTGSSSLTSANTALGNQSAGVTSAAWLQRRTLPWAEWYWGWGLHAEANTFHGANTFPLRRLQDVAAQFAVEYYVKGETAVSIAVRPGFYFENHPTRDAWDIPIEAVGGIPLGTNFSGVIGVLEARFYRHPIPVLGVVWIASPSIRLEAFFPEPALVVAINRKLEARLAGELGGSGFRTAAHQTVEYSSYRVGINVGYQLTPRYKITGDVGYEIERSFDFLQEGRRAHAGGTPYVKINLLFTR
jgi:hypothetical protein